VGDFTAAAPPTAPPSLLPSAGQSMAEDTEGIDVESGATEEVPAAGGGEETKRKRGRPKGSFKTKKKNTPKPKLRTKGRRCTGDRALASRAVSPGDLGRGVAAGPRVLRERRPSANAFYEHDSDTEVCRFSSPCFISGCMIASL